MSFRKDILERLNHIEAMMRQMQKTMASIGTGEVKRLEEQNKQLFNRLMSIDFEKYVHMAPENWDSKPTQTFEDSPLTDESNAGEILSDEDIGK